MKNISIEKITIKIGNKTLELTPDEAKELKLQLDGLIGTREYIPYQPYIPVPYIPYVEPQIYYPPYEITWGPVTSDQWSYELKEN